MDHDVWEEVRLHQDETVAGVWWEVESESGYIPGRGIESLRNLRDAIDAALTVHDQTHSVDNDET